MTDIKEKEKVANKHYRYFDRFVKIGLSDLPRRNIPALEFGDDGDTYTVKGIIHVGLQSPVLKGDMEEDELIAKILYLLGHEMQHVLSTPDKYWLWGQMQGMKKVCERISDTYEGKGKRQFRKEEDFGTFAKAMLEKHDLVINLQALNDFCHFVQNSLCDGRIERLRGLYHPGFNNYMLCARGKEWMDNPINYAGPEETMDPVTRLMMIFNQILSLATKSLYQKDYLRYYQESAMTELIDTDVLPLIKRGVLSPNCKGAMAAAIEIETLLTDEIIKAITLDAKALEKAMEQMMSSATSSDPCGSKKEEHNTKTSDEQTAEGAEDDDSEEEEGSNSGSDAASNGDGEENGKGRSDGDDEKEEAAKNKSGSSLGSSDDAKGSDAKKSDSGNPVKGDDNKNDGQYGLSLAQNSGHDNIGAHSDTVLTPEEIDAMEEMIKEAMEAAAEAVQGDVSTIQQSIPSSPKWEEKEDTSAPVPALKKPEKYGPYMKFDEFKRAYRPDTPMPVDLQSRADAFARKIDRLFHDQIKPVIRGHQSGNIDPVNIYKLVMGQTDFYTKKGQTPEFDGCAYFLGDNSGSMGYGAGSKRQFCTEAFAIAEEGFKRKMPLKITFFDAMSNNYVIHEVVKGFDEKIHSSCSYNFFLKGRNGAGNKDGYSIRIATEELLVRTEKNKILIIASDGCPSEYNTWEDGMADVKDAVKKAREKGIKVVCIYFSDHICSSDNANLEAMYEYDYIACAPEQIEDELAKVLQTFVFH